jgi:hypothetical protein
MMCAADADSRKCALCESEISANALLCPVCKNYQNSDRCRSCGSSIPPNSRICYVCKSNQREWKNWVVYIGGIAAFLTVISSGIVYFSSNLMEAIRAFTWKDEVKIGYFYSTGTTLFSNVGDGDVFLSDIDIHWGTKEDAHNFPLAVAATLRRGTFLSKELGAELPMFLPKEGVWGDFLATKDGSPNAILDSTVNANNPDACFLISFYDPNHHELERTRNFLRDIKSKELVTVKGHGMLHYYSAHTGKRLELDFPVLGGVLLRNTPKCREIALARGVIEP